MSLKNNSLIALIIVFGALFFISDNNKTENTIEKLTKNFQLKSNSIKEGKRIDNSIVYKGFGCEGGNLSPDFSWIDAPFGTKSYAITAYDPDAPTGSGWWHWVAFNIPRTVNAIPKGAKLEELFPGVVQVRNDYGQNAFGGPCPPVGDKPHNYIFIIWALKLDSLPLDKNASPALVGFYLNQTSLESASITATYGR